MQNFYSLLSAFALPTITLDYNLLLTEAGPKHRDSPSSLSSALALLRLIPWKVHKPPPQGQGDLNLTTGTVTL